MTHDPVIAVQTIGIIRSENGFSLVPETRILANQKRTGLEKSLYVGSQQKQLLRNIKEFQQSIYQLVQYFESILLRTVSWI